MSFASGEDGLGDPYPDGKGRSEIARVAGSSVVRGQHAAAVLMLVREYIQPLPRGLDTGGVTDNLTTDLGAMVMALREARQAIGYKG